MKWDALIQNLAGISQAQYNILTYEAGMAWLAEMEKDNERLIATLERSAIYWAWWRRQFRQLTMDFIRCYGIEALRTDKAHYVEKEYRNFVQEIKVGRYGLSSYVHLMDRVFDKQQQSGADLTKTAVHESDESRTN